MYKNTKFAHCMAAYKEKWKQWKLDYVPGDYTLCINYTYLPSFF